MKRKPPPHAHACKRTHARTHAHTCSCTNTRVRTCMQMHTHIHTCSLQATRASGSLHREEGKHQVVEYEIQVYLDGPSLEPTVTESFESGLRCHERSPHAGQKGKLTQQRACQLQENENSSMFIPEHSPSRRFCPCLCLILPHPLFHLHPRTLCFPTILVLSGMHRAASGFRTLAGIVPSVQVTLPFSGCLPSSCKHDFQTQTKHVSCIDCSLSGLPRTLG